MLSGCIHTVKQTTVTPGIAADALEFALMAEGRPYVWGADGPDGFDCSGLIVWAYKKAYPNIMFRVGNKKYPDVAMNDIWKYNTVPLLLKDIMPGDIVFITSGQNTITHGGLFIRWVGDDEFEFINASSYHGQVVVDTWPVDGLKREQWFVGAGRLKVAY